MAFTKQIRTELTTRLSSTLFRDPATSSNTCGKRRQKFIPLSKVSLSPRQLYETRLYSTTFREELLYRVSCKSDKWITHTKTGPWDVISTQSVVLYLERKAYNSPTQSVTRDTFYQKYLTCDSSQSVTHRLQHQF